MINRNNIKTCQYLFKNNKYYEKKHNNKPSYNDKTDNSQ